MYDLSRKVHWQFFTEICAGYLSYPLINGILLSIMTTALPLSAGLLIMSKFFLRDFRAWNSNWVWFFFWLVWKFVYTVDCQFGQNWFKLVSSCSFEARFVLKGCICKRCPWSWKSSILSRIVRLSKKKNKVIFFFWNLPGPRRCCLGLGLLDWGRNLTHWPAVTPQVYFTYVWTD